jgi:hypothetical protein
MKGDFSKIRNSKKHEQEKNYRKVLFQQGRVLTDPDWNDQVDIQVSHDTKSLRDIIGKNGVPFELKDSFKITPLEGKRYTIGKGRIYVDGILVENFYDVEAAFQPNLPSNEDPLIGGVGNRASEAIPKEPGIYLAYLDTWYRHVTFIEDPDIQESALGGPDTTTRSQVVWQVKLHKLKDEEAVNEPQTSENKWTPWVSLDNAPHNKIFDIRIGTTNDGSQLEVFALSEFEQVDHRIDKGIRTSRRQLSIDPVWEGVWNNEPSPRDFHRFMKIEIALNRANLLEMFGLNNKNEIIKSTRPVNERWGPTDRDLSFIAKEIAIGTNTDGSLELFAIKDDPDDPNDQKIYYSKQIELSGWDGWKPIGNMKFTKLSVVTNPNNDCIEVYAIEKTADSPGGDIWYTRQTESDPSGWKDWTKINPNDQDTFNEIAVGISEKSDSINRKKIMIFAGQSKQGNIWNTRISPDFPDGDGWRVLGENILPGKLISGSGGLSVQNNPKKNRLEVFGVFSNSEDNSFGNIWNIFEDENGDWESSWKVLDENFMAINVSSTIDKKSRLNIFAIENATGIVYHKYAENNEDLITCDLPIPSWESKIKPSSIQLKVRTQPKKSFPHDPCLLPEFAGYRRLENQLYRIEIHDPKSEGKNATFKFSRDNGTVCSKIINISGQKITVASIGRDTLLGFNIGQWIEIIDDLHELLGMPGVLVCIEDIDGSNLIFNSGALVPAAALINNDTFPQQFNPKARRWDSTGLLDVKIVPENDGFIEIEDGIEVQFNNVDICKTGDYYTIPARTLKADIEWPKGTDGLPEFVGAEGIAHHYAKLALLKFTNEDKIEIISDCRKFFPSLTDLASKSMIWWIHGTISQPEESKSILSLYAGTGATYKLDTGSKRINFPLGVFYPVDQDKKTTMIEKISVLFRTSVETKIIEIAIYDGAKQIPIPKLAVLSLSGIHDEKPDDSNTFTLDPPLEIQYGVGVSINVLFSSPSPSTLGEITFTSLGLQLKTV